MPHTLLSQLWHSPGKEQIPARKQRGVTPGQSTAAPSPCSSRSSPCGAPTVTPQVSPRGHPCYVTLVFSKFRCQGYYSFYLKVAANFQTSILHLLGCMRQVRAQQSNSPSHHLPETKKSALQDVT